MNNSTDSGEKCAICGNPIDPEDPLSIRPKLKPCVYHWLIVKNSINTYLVCGGAKLCMKTWIKEHGKPHYVESFATVIPVRTAPAISKTIDEAEKNETRRAG